MVNVAITPGQFNLLLPRPDVCQECAVDHKPEEPHNVLSLYYRVKFKMDHDRYPTWEDAIAHCSEEIKEIWKVELKLRNAWDVNYEVITNN